MNDAPQKSYHHGNLRNELLDTAEAQLAEAGTEELSLRALARRVGVSQTAPYRPFSDKNDQLAALAARGYRKLLDGLVWIRSLRARSSAGTTATWERVRAACRCDYQRHAI